MTTAKRRAVDQFRRRDRRDQIYAAIAHRHGSEVSEEHFLAAVGHVEDDVVRLMFICCHPALTPEAQCTLTLKLVGGLTTREIARAYLTTEATVAQRVVRAKRTLAEAGAAIEKPSEAERAERLTTVLGVIYLLFNKGYSGRSRGGDDAKRTRACLAHGPRQRELLAPLRLGLLAWTSAALCSYFAMPKPKTCDGEPRTASAGSPRRRTPRARGGRLPAGAGHHGRYRPMLERSPRTPDAGAAEAG